MFLLVVSMGERLMCSSLSEQGECRLDQRLARSGAKQAR